jgi:VCBS repeat-containing protein
METIMAANVCSTNPVATVIAIQGEAYARNAIGQMRKLFVGDVLLEGETIVTMPGGHVELGFTDGKKLAVLPHEGFNMTAESLGLAKIGEATEADKELAMQNAKAAAKKAASEAALQSGEIEQLVKAIEQGGAIDEQLEATAAGLGGGGESEGHDFVRLPRIIEDVTPVSYGWGPIGGGVLPPNPASDINLPPEADPDAQSLGEDTPSVSGNVISGLNSILVGSDDTDPDFDPLTVSAVSFGSRTGTIGAPIAGVWGTLVLNGDGSYTYTPNAHAKTLGVGKTGVDVFDYTVRDPAGATDSTTLTLTVVGSNDAPIPYTIPGDPDKPPVRDPNTDPTTGHYLHIIPEDTSVSGIVKATDVDGDPLTFTQNTQPSHGTAVVNPDGSYTYTPFQDYNGNDSFTVLVNDGNGGTAIAVVDIIITPVQDPSIITPGYGTVIEDTVLSTSGQLSITDVDGPQDQAFVPQSNVPGAHGSFSIDNNGNWVYNLNNSDPAVQALNLGDTLTETFTVNGVDGTPSTVTVTIQGVPENVAPNANDDSVSTTVNTPVPVAVLSNDDDPDGDPLTIQSFQPTTPNGTINQVGNQLVYTPNPGYTGTDTFTYTISDGRGGTDTATVTVSIGNAPVTPTVSVSNSVVPESTPYAEFTVSLSSPSTSDITVNLVLADNTAQGGGVDYGAVGPTNIQVFSGGTWQNRTTATFLAGETTILVRTPITSDTTDEPNETYTLTANVVSGTTTNPSATGTGTILDDDGAPSLSIIGPATVNEAIGTVVYTVTLTGSTATPVTVNYGTTPGTAESGQDYTPTSGTLTFAAGQTVAYVTVPVLNDTPPEIGRAHV